MKARKT